MEGLKVEGWEGNEEGRKGDLTGGKSKNERRKVSVRVQRTSAACSTVFSATYHFERVFCSEDHNEVETIDPCNKHGVHYLVDPHRGQILQIQLELASRRRRQNVLAFA